MNRLYSALAAASVFALLLSGCPSGGTTTNTYVIPMQVRIATQILPEAVEGASYSQTLAASGGSGTFTWSLLAGGTNDSWLTLDNAGALTGTPAQANLGAVTLFVKAQEEGNATNFDIALFTFDVTADPSAVRVKTTALADAWTGYAYSQALQGEGGSGTYTWRKLSTGTNDSWLTVAADGTVAGTPLSGNLGPATLRVRMTDTDGSGLTASASLTFTVFSGTISIKTSVLPNAAATGAYTGQLQATGGSGDYLWTLEPGGTNDSWLSMDGVAGTLTGTAPASGSISVVVGVCERRMPAINTQKTFTFTVKAMVINATTVPDAFVGVAYSQGMSVTGATGAVTWTVEPGGTNYSWLSFTGINLSSTTGPAAGNLGPVSVIIKADDGVNCDSVLLNLTVYNPVQITTTALPKAYAGVGYSVLPSLFGGTGSCTWSKESGGTNDSWLSVDPVTGRISGAPTAQQIGAVVLNLKVVDNANIAVFDTQMLIFSVNGMQISTSALPDGTVGVSYSAHVDAIGGSGFTAWSLSSGPAWLSINADNGDLSGTPSSGGVVNLVVSVYDPLDPAQNDTASYTFWVVNTIMKEGFENGTPTGWTLTGDWAVGTRDQSSSTDRLYVGPQAPQAGARCCGTAMTGLYTANRTWGSCLVTTSTFSCAGAPNPILVYYQWLQTECGNGADNDGGVVELSLNGGTSWNTPSPAFPDYSRMAGGVNAFGGYDVPAEGWRKVVIPLPTAANQANVRLRWSFYSDNDGIQNPGWYIDSIHVYDLGATAPAPKAVCCPIPEDGITYAPPDSTFYTSGVTLSWQGTEATSSYRVFLGNDYNSVLNATNGSIYDRGSVTKPSFSCTTLTPGNTYFWRIDSIGSSVTAGPVWSFTATNPVKVFVNEVQTYNYNYYGAYVELYNPSGLVHQEITGWQLTTSSSGGSLRTFTIPGRLILGPGKAKAFTQSGLSTHYPTNYSAWATVSMNYSPGWTYGTSEGEAWVKNAAGVGIDYMGFNVLTSNRPSDLSWTGSCTSTSATNSLWRRFNNTDTDSASDFRLDYVLNYGPTYGYMGEKDFGQ